MLKCTIHVRIEKRRREQQKNNKTVEGKEDYYNHKIRNEKKKR
jgi:hypothetical protein